MPRTLSLFMGDRLGGGVGGVFHHLVGLAVEIADRVVGSLDPDLLAALADPLVLGGLELAAVQAGPEFAIGFALLGRRHEHRVMLALDLVEPVADRAEEILVGGDDGAVHVEFDHGLRFADRLDLAGEIGGLQFLFADVGGEFHHLERLAGIVENRIVGRQDPDLLAALAVALVFGGLELAAAQRGPELAIGGAVALGRRHEHRMMLALDLVERIADRAEEMIVRGDDGAVEVELDHRLRARDRSDLAGVFHAADLARGDVGGELDHPDGLAAAIEDRIVGGLNPDLPATLGGTLVFRSLKLAAIEPGPEFPVGGALALFGIDEHAVMSPADFLEPVSHGLEEILVRGNNGAVHVELDNRPATCRWRRPSLRHPTTQYPSASQTSLRCSRSPWKIKWIVTRNSAARDRSSAGTAPSVQPLG